MKIIGSFIIIALLLLGAFLLANWGTLSVPTHLSFVFFEAEIPTGLIFMGVTLVFAVLLTSYALMLRTTMLLDARRHAQELDVQRKLAESAETSRFDQLRAQISLEIAGLHSVNQEAHSSLMTRTAEMEQALRQTMDEAVNGLSAHMGEMEEKLDRALGRSAG